MAEIKHIPKDKQIKPPPIYDAFTYQLSAMLITARQVKAEMKENTPLKCQKFLDEYDKKAA